jgi:hypothetical protein
VTNLTWFVLASIGWSRYAFPGVALGSLLVARLGLDAIDRARRTSWSGAAVLRGAAVCWILSVLVTGAVIVAAPIAAPPENAPAAMSAYLEREVPSDAVIETWEPELGALTAHNYHYPPNRLLATAVAHIWQGGPPPRLQYHPLETDRPPYVVVGPFAKWVGLYPELVLRRDYVRLESAGAYDLYRRRDLPAVSRAD